MSTYGAFTWVGQFLIPTPAPKEPVEVAALTFKDIGNKRDSIMMHGQKTFLKKFFLIINTPPNLINIFLCQ